MASYDYTFTSGDTVTPTKLNSARTVKDIVNADIKSDAAIALSKLATGALPTAITVASANLVDGTIVDADVNATAAIALSKLATGALPAAITVASANIVDGTIVNADINASAAIAGSKLADGAINNAKVDASAAIAHTKLANITAGQVLMGNASNVPTATALSGDVTVNSSGVTAIGPGVIVDADINGSAAIALSKLATGALPTAITVASANLVDGTIVNADISASAAIADSKLATISTAAKVSNSATTATSANTASAIVARDASGNFSAGTITASLTGNVTGNLTGTASAIADGSVSTAAKLASGVVTAAKLSGAQTGDAPIYACRAWVNFDGTTAADLAGTYTRTGTEVTVTATAHGLIVGNVVRLDFTTGGAADGTYTVTTVDNANTFRVTTAASGTIASSSVTLLRRLIKAAGNVGSVTYLNTAGRYVVNMAVAMPNADYGITVGSRNAIVQLLDSPAPTAQAFYLNTSTSTPSLTDDGFTACAVFA